MQHKIYDIQTLIAFRHHMHRNPELGMQCHNTKSNIKQYLRSIGVEQNAMKQIAVSALVVDIKGKAAAQGVNRCIAFRADMDALNMTEMNHHLEHRSTNGAAHMCGHDGHVTCLLGFVAKYLQIIDTIPENKIIRLLFQPSEEGPKSGAKIMIDQGCLNGVDQVYGFHNWPTKPVGQLWVKEGAVMAQMTYLKVEVIGTMGHGSQPEKVKDCIKGAVKFYQQIHAYIEQLKNEKHNFVCTLPVFQAGSRFNVFSPVCRLEGTIRSFEQKIVSQKITNKIKSILQSLQTQGFKHNFEYEINASVNFNTKQQSDHVLRVAKTVFGQDKAGQGPLPFKASEDFAYYTKYVPGAFFFLSSGKTENHPMLHSNNYEFNDDLIPIAANFWVALAQDRLK